MRPRCLPILLGVATLAGCVADPPPAPDPPPLYMLRSRHALEPDADTPRREHVRCVVTMLHLPIGVDTDLAWQRVGGAGVDRDALIAWGLNGLRVGTIAFEEADALIAALPPRIGAKATVALASEMPGPVYTAPRRGPSALELVGMDGRRRTVRLPRGTPRMLVRRVDGEGDAARLGVVPQHHFLQQTLTPRPAEELTLSGVVFDDLELIASLTPDRVLVIGWDHPTMIDPAPPQAPAASDPTTGEIEADEPAADTPAGDDAEDADAADGEEQAPTPAEVRLADPAGSALAASRQSIGRALLTVRRVRTPAHIMLLISLPGDDGTR